MPLQLYLWAPSPQQHAGVQDIYGSCHRLLVAMPTNLQIRPRAGRDLCAVSKWLILVWPLGALLLCGL